MRARISAALVAAVTAGVLVMAPGAAAFAGGALRPCAANRWTNVGFYVNPFWFLAPRVTVVGSTFDVRTFGGGIPPFWEADNISGYADVIISPSFGTSLEVRCHADA